MLIRFAIFLLFTVAPATLFAQSPQLKIAVINSGVQNKFVNIFAEQSAKRFKLLDADLTQVAVRGLKLENLFNLTLTDAKNLGMAVDCDFFLVIKSENLRRSSLEREVYFESYAVTFLVSARTGRLTIWEDRRFEADTAEAAEKLLLSDAKTAAAKFAAKIAEANERERTERAEISNEAVLIEDLPAEEAADAAKFRIPLPYKRLSPAYTAAAARLDIEATVDVAAELNENGEVTKTEVVRWAGFDLDEAAANTIKKMHFRPALRDGKAVPIRILLRYNFRDLQKQ